MTLDQLTDTSLPEGHTYRSWRDDLLALALVAARLYQEALRSGGDLSNASYKLGWMVQKYGLYTDYLQSEGIDPLKCWPLNPAYEPAHRLLLRLHRLWAAPGTPSGRAELDRLLELLDRNPL